MNNILRRFTHNFSFSHSSNFPDQYVQNFEFCVAARTIDNQVFVKLESYQKVSGKKLSALYNRITKFVVPYLYIDGDLYVDRKSIEVWLKTDKKSCKSIREKQKWQKMEEELLRCLRQPSAWFYGIENGFSEEDTEEMIDRSSWEDPDEIWKNEMAELERFAMLGF